MGNHVRERRRNSNGWTSALLLAGVAAFVAALASQRHYVPIWDSWIYATCVQEASVRPWEFERWGCAGHFSHAYAFLLGLPALLGAEAMRGMLYTNTILGVLAILSVHSLARGLLPGPRYRADCVSIAIAFAAHPVCAASAIFVNVDYGVLVFGLMTLASLFRKRLLCAVLAGHLLVFSKETGLAVYTVSAGSYCLCVMVPSSSSRSSGLRQLVHALPLLAPVVTLLLYVVWWRPRTLPLWGNLTVRTIAHQLLTFAPFTSRMHAQLAGIFVLQFMWIPSAAIAGWLLWRLASLRPGVRPRPCGARARRWRCLLSILVLLTFVLTRNQTSVSVRYYTVLYPLLLLAFLVAGTSLPVSAAWRRGFLGCLTIAFGVSNFRTVDPVSRYAYGTFPFGSHRLLAMNSINAECCGFGIDQLVYNFEFVRFHEAIDAALVELRPSGVTPIVVADEMDWYLMARMNATTCRRTLAGDGTKRVPHLDLRDLKLRRYSPHEFHFVALPNVDNRPSLGALRSQYTVTAIATHGRDGYLLTSYRMQKQH